MNHAVTLTSSDILISLITGFILCLIYLYLLWQTVLVSQKSSHPTLLLFISGTLRIFMLIIVALLCSQNNLARFLLIFCSFFLTRFIVLKIARPSFQKQVMDKEIITQNNKKSSATKKSTSASKKRKKSTRK